MTDELEHRAVQAMAKAMEQVYREVAEMRANGHDVTDWERAALAHYRMHFATLKVFGVEACAEKALEAPQAGESPSDATLAP